MKYLNCWNDINLSYFYFQAVIKFDLCISWFIYQVHAYVFVLFSESRSGRLPTEIWQYLFSVLLEYHEKYCEALSRLQHQHQHQLKTWTGLTSSRKQNLLKPSQYSHGEVFCLFKTRNSFSVFRKQIKLLCAEIIWNHLKK